MIVDALRGSEPVRERIAASADVLMISAITVEEITFGARPAEEPTTTRLLGDLPVIPVGRAAVALSGKWRRQHRARGITLQLSDTLIAASAYLAGAVLATGNVRDFPMPELTVEEWSSG